MTQWFEGMTTSNKKLKSIDCLKSVKTCVYKGYCNALELRNKLGYNFSKRLCFLCIQFGTQQNLAG